MLTIIFITCFVGYSLGANILFVSLIASPSHHIWNEVLVDGLLEKGHNITKLATFPAKIKNSNYTVLDVDVEPFLEGIDELIEETPKDSSLGGIFTNVWPFAVHMCNYSLNSDEFKTIMKYPKDFFNLIIFDITFSYCYYPLIDNFGTPPVIGVTAFGMQPYLNSIMGQRTENYVPYYALPYTDQMSFFQRFNNVIHQTVERFYRWYFITDVTEVTRNFFGKHIANLDDYEKNISLIFSNDDPILDYPKTFPPNVIPVGGIHVRKPNKLDQDLQKIMDKSTDGVILVSMGSNFKTKHYSDNAKQAFVEAFSRLNLTILWKFEGIDTPKNVVLRKWFSQSDVLAHPNTKLFVTHCGGLSSHETMVRGVPVVGIPLFADQHIKAGKFRSIKGGVILKYSELTADMVYNAITEVLSNPEYKQNMLKVSNLYQSQPQQPLVKFSLWTEYLLKNGHLDYLSVAARNMTWYQVDNWDIFGLCVTLLCAVGILLKTVCCYIKKICKRAPNKKQKIQ